MDFQSSTSRIFSVVEETESLLSSLFQSLSRADQDAWLRKTGLARDPDQSDHAGAVPMRGFSNVASLLSGAKRQQHMEKRPASQRFEVSNVNHINHALRLAGEDHTPEEVTAIPRTFDICPHGARAHRNHLRGWFDELAGNKSDDEDSNEEEGQEAAAASQQQEGEQQNNNNNKKEKIELLPLPVARKEYAEQEHFGLLHPERVFDTGVSKFPLALERNALTFDEFAVIFAHFEYA